MDAILSKIAEELILMRDYDFTIQGELEESGELFEGYSERMEMVHQQNALRLETIMEEIGWPDAERFGEEANEAALLIVLHSISMPEFQRIALANIKLAVETQKEEGSNYAFLYDRICFNERRPQLFGTQFDWDENGEMSPWKIEFPEKADILRTELGMPALKEQTNEIRESVKASGENPPLDFMQRQSEILEWCRKTGWIK